MAVGEGGEGAMFLALPLPASRWRQEPKKRALGFCPVGCEAQVFRDPQHLGQTKEDPTRFNRKPSGAGGALRAHSAQVGRLGSREKRWGQGNLEAVSASYSKGVQE